MKVFPALVIIVMVAGFCRAKHLGDISSARCSVKDKIVRNRSNAFEFIRDIRNWQKSVTELMVALFGASGMKFATSTHRTQIESCLTCPVPSVERGDARSNISRPEFHENDK